LLAHVFRSQENAYVLWKGRTLTALAPAEVGRIEHAVHAPTVTRFGGVCHLRSNEHAKSEDQSQHCKKERKDPKFSEEFHLFSPPFTITDFDSMLMPRILIGASLLLLAPSVFLHSFLHFQI
jgi:hypothetical protein